MKNGSKQGKTAIMDFDIAFKNQFSFRNSENRSIQSIASQSVKYAAKKTISFPRSGTTIKAPKKFAQSIDAKR